MTTIVDAFAERYPELAFLCQMAQEKPAACNAPFTLPDDVNDVEGVYLYGLNSEALEAFGPWLAEESMRDLIVVEDDIARVLGFLELEGSEKWIANPQVHIKMPFQHQVGDREFCRELAKTFPLQKIAVYAAKPCSDLDAFALELRRMTTLTHGRFCEYFYHHRLFDNLVPNFKRFGQMFLIRKMKDLFKGRPAIVCGAGPSLSDSIEDLKAYRDQALILAGGSTIAALSNQGVNPHVGLVIDPNPEEYPRLKASSAFTVPLVMGARVLPDIFNTNVSDIGYMQSIACDITEYWVSEQLGIEGAFLEEDMGEEALSVTTSCIALAEYMGCNPIVLAGVDLAFTNAQAYAKGVFSDVSVAIDEKRADTRACEKLMEASSEEGEKVYTNVKWVMESACISQFAKKSQSRFYKATKKGLKIDKISYKPLKTIMDESDVKRFYIDGFLQTAICDSHVPEGSFEKLSIALSDLKASLEGCQKHLTALINVLDLHREEFKIEGAHFLLHEMDLQEELAYRCLLFGMMPSIEFATHRKERGSTPDALWRKKRSLYTQLLERVQSLLETFERHCYTEVNSQNGF